MRPAVHGATDEPPAGAPLKSSIDQIAFPPIPSASAARLLALQYQFERSQFWPAPTMQAAQLAQLEILLAHCERTVPFYAERLRAAGIAPGRKLTMAAWRRLPPLTRADIQMAGPRLHSTAVPAHHGRASRSETSGSTGMPVRVLKTELSRVFWQALVLREMLWGGRAPSSTMVLLRRDPEDRARPPHGRAATEYGPPASLVFHTGPSFWLDVRSPIADQAAFVARHNPDLLVSFPSNIALVARHCAEAGIAVPNLRTVQTFGEVVTDEFRALCRNVWGAIVADAYSTEEVGQIALQCPTGTHYHVQSEVVLTEVLDDDGRPSKPGRIGRVVVTPLHNFAMPLLRYDIGDYAEVGRPCACGRALPVLTRILGRARNRVVLPGGERRYAHFGARKFAEVAALKQFQLVQTTTERVEIRAVLRRPLTADEEAFLAGMVRKGLGYPFEVAIVPVAAIARSATGKYEDFRSDVP